MREIAILSFPVFPYASFCARILRREHNATHQGRQRFPQTACTVAEGLLRIVQPDMSFRH